MKLGSDGFLIVASESVVSTEYSVAEVNPNLKKIAFSHYFAKSSLSIALNLTMGWPPNGGSKIYL